MNSTTKWLWQVPGKKKSYVLLLTLLQGLRGSVGVILAFLLRGVVDSAVAGDAARFWRYIGYAVLLALVNQGLGALIRWLNERAKCEIENLFKQRLTENILRRDYSRVSATHTAEWLNRLTSDTALLAAGYVEILPGLAAMAVRLVAALVMILVLDAWFAWILLPGGALLILLSTVFRRALKRLHKGVQESDGRLRVFLQERLSSLTVIKAFDARRQVAAGAAEAMQAHQDARMRRNRFANLCNVGFGLSMEGMYLLGLAYCAHGVMTGRVSFGTLTAILQLIGQLQSPFANLSAYLPRWYAMTASAERLMEIEAYAEDGPIASAEEMRRYYEEDFEALCLRGASFRYPSHEGEQTPPVLDSLDLELRRGETLAFTGQSGCGKSTALRLLLCLYPLEGGSRCLRGAKGEEELCARHRRLFAYVPQGNVLMNGSIRELISFAAPERAGEDELLRRALYLACAEGYTEDLDLVLGERGAGLSEGQLQRIAIARAIFADAPILLLDEATSALDAETERELLQRLRTLTDKSVILVTHRPAALELCDRVVDFSAQGRKA